MRTSKSRHGAVALALCASGALVLLACGGGTSFGGASKTQATGPAKLTTIPVALLFFAFQRYLVRGANEGAEKG